MSEIIQVERFTRQMQSISGTYAPGQLTRLAEYLAGADGEIRYALSGREVSELGGSQKRCIKCIISGWFLVTDPANLKPTKHHLAIESSLVVVRDESGLPPLELESEDEDYIVCWPEMNVMERVEEEILLDLPSALAISPQPPGKREGFASANAGTPDNAPNARVSPFAGLAELKRK
ncbi:MAG: hypothetical protein IPP88_06335 [Betaproteobacteria bacterium]|nr:hypothetical protein [Betaproteobacteria bacterium]